MQKRFDVVFNNTQDWRRPAEEFGAVRSTQADKRSSDKNRHSKTCEKMYPAMTNDPKPMRKCTLYVNLTWFTHLFEIKHWK